MSPSQTTATILNIGILKAGEIV